MSTSDLIELSGVSYEIDGCRILDAVSWRIRPREHWVLLGRNGAGKTTLLQIACGYLWPNAGGQVLRGGRALTDSRQLRRSIGWVTSTLDCADPARRACGRHGRVRPVCGDRIEAARWRAPRGSRLS